LGISKEEKYRRSNEVRRNRRRTDPEYAKLDNDRHRKARAENPEHHKEIAKRSRLRHIEERRITSRAYAQANKERLKEYHRQWNIQNRELARIRKVVKNFRITAEEYLAMVEYQNNLCAICKQLETLVDKHSGLVRNLHVDHNHTTGKVRGLLCTACNTAIGNFKEDTNTIRAAISYIELHDGVAANALPAPPV